MDTPTLAAYQTPELSSGGGDTRLVGTHSALHIPGNRSVPRADWGNLYDLVPATPLSLQALGRYMDTPTLAAYQTPELSSGGGDTRLVGTHSALHIPGNRSVPRADWGNLYDLVPATPLSLQALGRYMDTPTLAAYQTPELSSGGGDTRLVRTHSALHIPGNRGFPRADLGNLHDLVLGVNVSATGSMDLDTLLSRISRLSVVSRQLLRFEWAIMDGQETTHATFPGRNPYGKQLLEAHIAAQETVRLTSRDIPPAPILEALASNSTPVSEPTVVLEQAAPIDPHA